MMNLWHYCDKILSQYGRHFDDSGSETEAMDGIRVFIRVLIKATTFGRRKNDPIVPALTLARV